jgi:PAS domain S-box-containing protein
VQTALELAKLRRLAADAATQSEQEIAEFFENATIPAHSVGADGVVLRVNQAELELLGYTRDEYVGHSIAEFHVDADVVADMLRRLSAGETLRHYAARLRCKDGTIKHVLIDSSVRWINGRFGYTRCFTRDITDQKRAEEMRLRLAAIVESSDDAIISKDMNGVITSWNRAAERLYGYTADEIVGKTISMLIPPDHTDDFPGILQRLRGGERIDHYETVRIAKDGRRIDVSLTISPIRNAAGHIIGASKIAHDISERKRAEALARRHTERTRLLWEAASVLLTTDEPDAMLRGLFAKLGVSLGIDAYLNYMLTEDGDGLRLVSWDGLPQEIAPAISKLEFGELISGRVALRRAPIVASRIQESDDPMLQLIKQVGIRAYASTPLAAGERLLGTLSFASRTRDAFEPDEVEFFQTISHYVTSAYERLRLIEQLRDQDRLKDEFLATLAHELRNPLAPIRTGVQLVRMAGHNPALIEKTSPMMERQIQHMVRLVDDLLDVSRISRNKLELRKEKIELGTLIQSALETSRPLIEAAGHELTVSVPPEPILLEADGVRLAQAFSNLLNNAAKYTPEGGRISLTADTEHGEVVVRVRDNGLGIPADKLSRIFEMFVQVDRSIGQSHGGLGIGLSLAKRLVQMHGGTIEAYSDGIGKGSEVVVRLPAAIVTRRSANGDGSAPATARAASRRVLVVDDNRDSAEALATMLQLLGHDVATAHDGRAAVDGVRTFQPDVALLDIGMPHISGYEAARLIRQQPGGTDVFLVALTGWGHDDDKLRSLEAGFDAHLVKPVDVATIEKVLESSRGVRHEFVPDAAHGLQNLR